MAGWFLRLATDPIYQLVLSSDPHLFSLLYACCASAVKPPEALNMQGYNSAGVSSEQMMETLKDLQQQFGKDVSGKFARLYLQGFEAYVQYGHDSVTLRKHLKEWQQQATVSASEYISAQEDNVARLAKLLKMTKVEQQLFLLQLNSGLPGFNHLLRSVLSMQELAPTTLATMLGCPRGKISDALDETSVLVRSGLLTVTHRPLQISPPSAHMRAALTSNTADDAAFFEIFVKPLTTKPTTASLARLDDKDTNILLPLLDTPYRKDRSINILIYGSRNVDKQDMLARLFDEHDLKAYALVSKDVAPSDMPAWAFIAQRWMEKNDKRAILVLDRAEQVLAAHSGEMTMSMLFGFGEPDPDPEKASDAGLTSSAIKCVWIAEQPKMLSERNLGRFLFHCEARPGSRGERRKRIEQVINEFDLSPEIESHLSKYSFLGESQVRQAADLAKLLHGTTAEQQDVREMTIKRAIHQSQRILDREQTEDLRDSVTHYSLDNLNLNGRFSPKKIIQALHKRPRGTLCFYGIPGAGKTQLAEYMAVELDKPLLLKRASDILSKWLGESEQNIAAMFAEAEAENAILLLDEADSFLRDRAMARAEWSVTQVNELLQQMERFDGIFIAATNLFQDMDAAALRRFTWKVEFLPLRPEQSWQMFLTETGFDEAKADTKEAEDLKESLLSISNLAPGDFATVKRQAVMLDENLAPRDWLEQLEIEAKAKMAGLARNKIGFGS